ncbi:MAG: glycosyltransferase family 1 protein [Solirubrobacteraceae bacterium]
MRVAFDSRPASGPSGIARYARSLRTALGAEAQRRGGEIVDAHRPRGVDLYHSPWIDGALLRPRIPMVVTLHDLIPMKRPGEYLRSGLRFRMRYLAVERASRVIVPTTTVAEDAVAMLKVDAAHVHVVPEAADPAFSPRSAAQVAAARKRHALPDDYLVWVGGLRHPDPRKRVAALAGTPSKLPVVLVGDPGPWARELPDVILTGAVDDDELAALYTGARALVFPSDDEGFGLPTVEALACGTPVVACDVPALREVLGNRATFVDTDDLDGLVAAGAAAERPAPDPPAWTWDDAARATWDVYELASAQR